MIRRDGTRFGMLILLVAQGLMCCLVVPESRADQHTSDVPRLNSLPGAPYTIYLDFAGFNFTGNWQNNPSLAPGNTPAYDNISATGSFNAAEQSKIGRVWANVAQAYASFNVNVTTVDPAVAGGQSDTDAHRQAYYDRTPRLMHTVIGPEQNYWIGRTGVGGYSSIGSDQWSYNPASYNGGAGAGWKTNWIFTNDLPVNTPLGCGQVAAHENGHGLSLYHQSAYIGNSLGSEYSVGETSASPGTYGPIMGAGYYSQRAAWRLGDSDNGQPAHYQNDVAMLLSNSGIGGFVEDHVGHSLLAATPMPLSGSNVDFSRAKGIISPASTAAPTPIGASNYTTDFFSFHTDGGSISLTAYDGTEFLSPGTADPGTTLRSTLSIFDQTGLAIGTATENASTLSETFSGVLPAGNYYTEVASYGGADRKMGLLNECYYFDMGAYFLTGSGLSPLPVPEPGTLALLAAGLLGLAGYAWRRSSQCNQ